MTKLEKIEYDSGGEYLGEVQDGKRHGKGTLLCENSIYKGKEKIVGQWKNDKLVKGNYELLDSKGEFSIQPTNVIYSGEFNEESSLYFHGKGTLKIQQKKTQNVLFEKIYKGNFIEGAFTGYGSLELVGKNELGEITEVMENYVGDFYNSERHGFGKFVDAAGNIKKGIWKYDKFIKKMHTNTLTIKAADIPNNIKKFDDYTKLVLVDGDFDEYDVDLDESIFNLSEYYGKFETIKTLHFKNWHTDDTFFPHKTLEEISCLFPDIEKIIIEDFKENELVFSTDSLLEFEYLREIKLINSQLAECSGEGSSEYSDDLYKLECLERTDSLSIQSEEKLHNFKNLKFIKNLFIQRINVAEEFIEVVKNYEIENLYINYCKKDIKLLKDNFSNMKKIPEHSKWVVENL